jgi:arginine-tRNA-protein transferase
MMVEDSHVDTRIIEYRRTGLPPRDADEDEDRPQHGRGGRLDRRHTPARRSAGAPLRHGGAGTTRGTRSGDLVAVALTDVLGDGLSMVYSCFEPGESARSLGTLMVLDHIARAQAMGLAYVYLGYWVRGSGKMDYKGRFLPQERLTPDGWVRAE